MKSASGVVRVCHMTTLHRRDDARVRLKECATLSRAGYEVILLVADGKGDTDPAGAPDAVHVVDVGLRPASRRERFRFSASTMLARAREIDAEIYHFHDPELIPAGLALKREGKVVIYDSHEDLPRQLLSKTYIAGLKAKLASIAAELGEDYAARRFDAVIAVTETIAVRFRKFARRTVLVANYPSLGELGLADLPSVERERRVCYVGGLSVIRGSASLLEAAKLCRYPIHTAGPFDNDEVKREVLSPDSALVHHGFLDRRELAEFMTGSMAGIMTYLPRPNHMTALPTKLYDYMAAGLPVIVSNFPLWKSIVEEGGCGICVDPENPRAIAEAVESLLDDPEKAARMGENARRLVVEGGRSWAAESVKLLDLYKTLEQDL